jgi:hypothetical protein
MTSWSVPSSPIRYFQCPFCQRTHSSHYGEVFRNRAGARVLATVPGSSSPSQIPMARPEDARWASIRTAANRWYSRLEADEQRNASTAREQRTGPRATPPPRPIPLTVAFEEPRRRDPLDDLQIEVELDPAAPVTARPPIQLAVVAVAGKRR